MRLITVLVPHLIVHRDSRLIRQNVVQQFDVFASDGDIERNEVPTVHVEHLQEPIHHFFSFQPVCILLGRNRYRE